MRLVSIAACNPRQKLLVVYAFSTAAFSLGGQLGRAIQPNPSAVARENVAVEDYGVQHDSVLYSAARNDEQGPLFGEPTSRWLPAKSKAQVRFLILLFKVPETFRGVASVGYQRSMLSSPELVAGSFQSRQTIPVNGVDRRLLAIDIGSRVAVKRSCR